MSEERLPLLEKRVAELERIVSAMTAALEPAFPSLEEQHVAFVERIRGKRQEASQ